MAKKQKELDGSQFINLEPMLDDDQYIDNSDDPQTAYTKTLNPNDTNLKLESKLDKKKIEKIYNEIISSLEENVSYLEERIRPMSYLERLKRAKTMRRFATKIEMARERASKRKATPERIKQRAKKRALEIIRNKINRNKEYSSLSVSEKMAIDKRLQMVPQAVIDRIARKVIPTVKQAEAKRLQNMYSYTSLNASSTGNVKTESTNINEKLKEEFQAFVSLFEGSEVERIRKQIESEKLSDMNKHKTMLNNARRVDKRRKLFKEEETSYVNKILELESDHKHVKNALNDFKTEISKHSNPSYDLASKIAKQLIIKYDLDNLTSDMMIKLYQRIKHSKAYAKDWSTFDTWE